MPRYRIAFAREYALGRWGFLDRFFHDLGGRESEPSGLANAWVVNFRGPPRRLGRELAMALNIGEADYRQFGPIFEIEELAGPRVTKSEARPVEPPAGAEASPPGREPAETPDGGPIARPAEPVEPAERLREARQPGREAQASQPRGAKGGAQAFARGADRTASAPGPTWIRAADVEDVTTEAPPAKPDQAASRGAQRAGSASGEGRRGESASSRAQARWDDLFRIRTRSKPLGRHRSDAISGATRRRPPADRSPL